MRIIAGRWRGHRLEALKGRDVRPTTDRVRESWMSAMGGAFHGLSFVDLFAGSGALGLEALSRGAERVVLVERARGALRVLEKNVERLGAGSEVQIVSGDVFAFLERLDPGHPFDVALADPPYATDDARRLLHAWTGQPFARELWLEHPWRHDLPVPDDATTRRYGDTALTTLNGTP